MHAYIYMTLYLSDIYTNNIYTTPPPSPHSLFAGIYVLMFGYMIKTFVQALFLSVPILIAFTLAFHMAFYSPGVKLSPFFNPAQTIITVLSYSLGGADYNALFALSHEREMDNVIIREDPERVPFRIAATILWILFLIVMLILLVNMLVSLAI